MHKETILIKFKFFLLTLPFLISLNLFAQPTISSFTPLSGPAGTIVTINGTNFNSSPDNNVVYFGAVRAVVSAATATSLTVTAPSGTSYLPVSVTSNSLTAYADKPFIITFPGGERIVQGSFDLKQDTSYATPRFNIVITDIDGDSKPDMVTTPGNSNKVSIFRNTSTSGTFSFDQPVDSTTGSSANYITTGDIDGDGKTDLITTHPSTFSVSILRNTSTPGSISFAGKAEFFAGSQYFPYVFISDIDGDGKPDLIFSGGSSDSICVLPNTSTAGSFSFASRIYFAIGSHPDLIAAGDIDGDGKPDLAIGIYGSNKVCFLRNTSAAVSFSFAPKIDFSTGTYPVMPCIGDLDGDGKPDISIANYLSNTISIFKNISLSGVISFNSKIDFPCGRRPSEIVLTDLDGDGKPDITVINFLDTVGISVLKNTSTAGAMSFAQRIYYGTEGPAGIAVGDIDGDSKPDIAVTNPHPGPDILSLFRNKINEPIIDSVSPVTGITGSLITLKGSNFTGAADVSFGGTTASSYNVVSDSVITAIVGTGTTGMVSVSGLYGTGILNDFGYNIPLVTSFSPNNGPAGTSVTINGNYFSNNPQDNIVYFGATKATVDASTTTSLTTTVPISTTYQPISMEVDHRTTYSTQPFVQSFPGGGRIASNSFSPKTDFSSGTDPSKVAISDLNGDGKPDAVVANSTTNTISVFRNTSTGGTVSFSPKTDYGSFATPKGVAIGDVNGDGKPDVVVANSGSSTISIFINTSTGNTISLIKTAHDLSAGNLPYGIAINDIDADGKPDMIVTTYPGFISILRNTTVNGVVSFAARKSFACVESEGTFGIAVADLDEDAKPEIIVSHYAGTTVSVFKNNSISGTIILAPRIDLTASSSCYSVAAGDLDGDGKTDLAVTSYAGTVAVFRNTSTPGTISFLPKVDFTTGAGCIHIALGDIDGDTKPDIATANYGGNSLSVLKNTSTPGAISFAAKSDYITGSNPYGVAIGDITSDGKPELFSANKSSGNFSVFKNRIGDSIIVQLCPPSANTIITSDLTGNNYQWQVNSGSGFTNISDNINYTGTNTVTLQLNNIPSSWHSYKYRCQVNSDYSIMFSLRFANVWTGAAGTAWEDPANWSCGVTPDSNTDVIINTGIVVLNSNITIRTLTLNPGVILTVNPGFILTIIYP